MTDLAAQAKHETIEVEVAYALPERQVLMTVQVPVGTTVEQAICHSSIMNQFPEIDLNKNRIGIFSIFVERKTVLQQRDRIEIYRPLLIDPKEARRLRVKRKSVKKCDNL
ncbi:MAG: RnfH family protein [Burkholderiales bacterium]|nr:RnfH family protein [Nitrosomonas sp.]MCP5275452.1 RnfH family protein [Burkholderiales bacterium]